MYQSTSIADIIITMILASTNTNVRTRSNVAISFLITEKSVNYFDKQNYHHENHDYPYQIKCGHDVFRIPSAPSGCHLPCHRRSKSNPTTPDRMTHAVADMTSCVVSLFYFLDVRVYPFSSLRSVVKNHIHLCPFHNIAPSPAMTAAQRP